MSLSISTHDVLYCWDILGILDHYRAQDKLDLDPHHLFDRIPLLTLNFDDNNWKSFEEFDPEQQFKDLEKQKSNVVFNPFFWQALPILIFSIFCVVVTKLCKGKRERNIGTVGRRLSVLSVKTSGKEARFSEQP